MSLKENSIVTPSKLDLSLRELNKCQYDHNINSCMQCIKLVDCNTRKDYIKEVYLSMNPNLDKKDEGFNF